MEELRNKLDQLGYDRRFVEQQVFPNEEQVLQLEAEIGSPLPTLPLWLTESLYVPLELETTYENTCRGLRIR